MRKVISTNNAPQAIGPYVQGSIVGNMVYTSGQIPLTKDGVLIDGDITEQTRQVMQNLLAILEAAGAKPENVIKTTCFLSDMNNFVKFNEEYAKYFTAPFPARSCVEVARLPKDVLVEVEAIAVLS